MNANTAANSGSAGRFARAQALVAASLLSAAPSGAATATNAGNIEDEHLRRKVIRPASPTGIANGSPELFALSSIEERLAELCRVAETPIPLGVAAAARVWTQQLLQQAAMQSLLWLSPHITDIDGAVALEWWRGSRKLTVYIEADRIEYVMVSGPSIDEDMVHAELKPNQMAVELWRWLMS